MDVFSPAYSGKHQYRQVTAEVFAEGLQTFQHFAGAVFCPAGKQGVEYGEADKVFSSPSHEYTQALLAAVPRL